MEKLNVILREMVGILGEYFISKAGTNQKPGNFRQKGGNQSEVEKFLKISIFRGINQSESSKFSAKILGRGVCTLALLSGFFCTVRSVAAFARSYRDLFALFVNYYCSTIIINTFVSFHLHSLFHNYKKAYN